MNGSDENPMKDVEEPRFVDAAKKKVQPTVDGLKEKIDADQLKAQSQDILDGVVHVHRQVNIPQVVTAVAAVGILWTTRRHLKFAKKVVKNMNANMLDAQNVITSLKQAGKPFTFYPGIGVWVD